MIESTTRRIWKRRARRIREIKARQRADRKAGGTPLARAVAAALSGCGNPNCPDCAPRRSLH